MSGFKLDRNAVSKLEKDVQNRIDKRTGGIEVGPTLAATAIRDADAERVATAMLGI